MSEQPLSRFLMAEEGLLEFARAMAAGHSAPWEVAQGEVQESEQGVVAPIHITLSEDFLTEVRAMVEQYNFRDHLPGLYVGVEADEETSFRMGVLLGLEVMAMLLGAGPEEGQG